MYGVKGVKRRHKAEEETERTHHEGTKSTKVKKETDKKDGLPATR